MTPTLRSPPPPGPLRAGLPWRAAVALLLVAALIVAVALLPLEDWLVAAAEWIRTAGALGVATYVGLYVAAAVSLAPGSLLTLTAGFAYGLPVGVLVASPASVLAATIAFLLGRTVARPWVERRLARNPRTEAVRRAVGRGGLRVVVLLRLSPLLPFNLLNYALGVTSVRLGDYVVGSFIGMLPATILFVYLGSLVTNAASLLSGAESEAAWRLPLWGVGALATLVVSWTLARHARAALNELLTETTGTDGSEGSESGPGA